MYLQIKNIINYFCFMLTNRIKINKNVRYYVFIN